MPKRFFQYIGGGSRKFWNVDLITGRQGTPTAWSVVCEWGRIGQDPRMLPKNFISRWDAEDFIRKKIREKLEKGYDEVFPSDRRPDTVLITSYPTNATIINSPIVSLTTRQLIPPPKKSEPSKKVPVRSKPVPPPKEEDDGVPFNERFAMLEFPDDDKNP